MIVAIAGRSGSGKTTLATNLVARQGFIRLGFADDLKQMLLRIDPFIASHKQARLAATVAERGWEGAKDFPETRFLLQETADAVKWMCGETFWADRATNRALDITAAMPPGSAAPSFVFDDLRYEYELDALVRLAQHGLGPLVSVRLVVDPQRWARPPTKAHSSETQVFPVDIEIGRLTSPEVAISLILKHPNSRDEMK